MKNIDLLQLMSVEDLAAFLCSMTYCQDCPHESKCESREEGYTKWLLDDASIEELLNKMGRLVETSTDAFGVSRHTLVEPTLTPICNECWAKNTPDCGKCSLNKAVRKLGKFEEHLHDGRLFLSDVKLGSEVYFIPKYNGAPYCGISAGHVQAVSFTRAGVRVKIREYHPHNQDFMLGKTAFTTMEAATEAYESLLKKGNHNE